MMVGVALQLIIPLSLHLARVEERRVHPPNKYRSKREGGVLYILGGDHISRHIEKKHYQRDQRKNRLL
jgi:hypothetical protein